MRNSKMKKRILNIIICLTLAMFLIMGIGCNGGVKFQSMSTGRSNSGETDEAGSSEDEQKNR